MLFVTLVNGCSRRRTPSWLSLLVLILGRRLTVGRYGGNHTLRVSDTGLELPATTSSKLFRYQRPELNK